MTDKKKQDIIEKLKTIRERCYVLADMLGVDYKKTKKKIGFATEAKEDIDELIYELTEDEFYNSKTGGKNDRKK